MNLDCRLPRNRGWATIVIGDRLQPTLLGVSAGPGSDLFGLRNNLSVIRYQHRNRAVSSEPFDLAATRGDVEDHRQCLPAEAPSHVRVITGFEQRLMGCAARMRLGTLERPGGRPLPGSPADIEFHRTDYRRSPRRNQAISIRAPCIGSADAPAAHVGRPRSPPPIDLYTNWYLLEEGGRLTVLGAGLPMIGDLCFGAKRAWAFARRH